MCWGIPGEYILHFCLIWCITSRQSPLQKTGLNGIFRADGVCSGQCIHCWKKQRRRFPDVPQSGERMMFYLGHWMNQLPFPFVVQIKQPSRAREERAEEVANGPSKSPAPWFAAAYFMTFIINHNFYYNFLITTETKHNLNKNDLFIIFVIWLCYGLVVHRCHKYYVI